MRTQLMTLLRLQLRLYVGQTGQTHKFSLRLHHHVNCSSCGSTLPPRSRVPTRSNLSLPLLQSIHSMNSSASSDSGSAIDKRDHLATTAHQQRDKDIHEVTVAEMYDISPTVKKLVLSPKDSSAVHFKAGQWIDLFMPDNQVGGFSIVSSPTHLRKTGLLELAVKYSDWPSTFWIHTNCHVGCKLSMRVGGDFYFDPEDILSLQNKTIVFIAGGVGINPLASMIFHIEGLKQQTPGLRIRTALLFSAKTTSELLFRDAFESIAKRDDGFKLRFFVTSEKYFEHSAKYSTAGRIGKADLMQALAIDCDCEENQAQAQKAKAGLENKLVYICGPSPFIQDIKSTLRSLGISRIFYENWWTGDAKEKKDAD